LLKVVTVAHFRQIHIWPPQIRYQIPCEWW